MMKAALTSLDSAFSTLATVAAVLPIYIFYQKEKYLTNT
jgi:hypothetical protein